MYSEKILTPEQLQAIGSVAVEASRLEEWIEMLIWELCGFDEKTGRAALGFGGVARQFHAVDGEHFAPDQSLLVADK